MRISLVAILATAVLGGKLRSIERHNATDQKASTVGDGALWVTQDSPEIFCRGSHVHIEGPLNLVAPMAAVLKSPALLPDGKMQYWEINALAKDKYYLGVTHANATDGPIDKGYNFFFMGLGGSGELVDGHRSLDPMWCALDSDSKAKGVLAEYKDEKLDVYFYDAGEPLGKAFSVPATAFPNGVKLAVQTHGPAQISIVSEPSVPKQRERSFHKQSYSGQWQMTEGPFTAVDGNLPVIRINERPYGLEVTCKVLNLRVAKFFTKAEGGYFSADTMILNSGGPEDLMKLEDELDGFLKKATAFVISEDDSLTISAEAATAKLTRVQEVNTITAVSKKA